MKLDTAFFRLIAKHSEHALLAMATSLAEKKDAEALRELLPVFLQDMRDSAFSKYNLNADVVLNTSYKTTRHSFFRVFQMALQPVGGSDIWTPGQAAFFYDLTPYLQQSDDRSHDFLNSAVGSVRDTRLLQLQKLCKAEAQHTLLFNALANLNAPMFSSLIKQTEPGIIHEWLKDAHEDVAHGHLMDVLAKCTENTSMRPVVDQLIDQLDPVLGQKLRLHLLAIAITPYFVPNAPLHVANEPARTEPFSDAEITHRLGVKSMDFAMDVLARQAATYAEKTQSVKIVSDLRSKTFEGASVARLIKGALQTHTVSLLKACESVIHAIGDRFEPYKLVMNAEASDLPEFRKTVAYLEKLGHPLSNMRSLWGEVTPISALTHLAMAPDHASWHGKLAVLLDLGAHPSARDEGGKRPVDLMKPKARRGEWESIVASHAARHAARHAIDTIAAEEHTAPTP